MRLRSAAAVIAVSLSAAASTAHADTTLLTAGGFEYDIDDDGRGVVLDGTDDAYDSAFQLSVGGIAYNAGMMASMPALSGRMLVTAPVTVSGLSVQRYIYVPAAAGEYIRYADVLTNTGSAAVTTTVEFACSLGSDSRTMVQATSSGDAVVSAEDRWLVTDDGTGSDPAVGFLVYGDGGTPPTSFGVTGSDTPTWRYDVTVDPGARAVLLTFATQARMPAEAQANIEALLDLPADAIEGIDDLLVDAINYAPPSGPRVRFTAPATAAEGEAMTFEVAVTQPDGLPTTFSWDLDGDGTFGESEGATMVTVPAGTTDGPGQFVAALQASDGTTTITRSARVAITNVEPMITSAAPTSMLFVNDEFRYVVEVADPGGERDPIVPTVMMGPEGMAFRDLTLAWTPARADRDKTFMVTLEVTDGDGGRDEQSFQLVVGSNRPPVAPMPMAPADRADVSEPQPTLVVTNGMDPDGDAVQYFFRVDRAASFDTTNLISSDPLAPGDGTTSFRVPSALDEGVWYWQVWASDGLAESERKTVRFRLVPEGRADAGVDGGVNVFGDGGLVLDFIEDDDGCCAVAPGASRRGDRALHGALAGLGFAIALTVRRRRRRAR